jgi:hypothetical protein
MRSKPALLIEMALLALVVLMLAACAGAGTCLQRRDRCGGPRSATTPAVMGSVGIGYPLVSFGAGQRITTTDRAVSALKLWHEFGANSVADQGRLRVSAGHSVAPQMGRNVRFPRIPIPHPRT